MSNTWWVFPILVVLVVSGFFAACWALKKWTLQDKAAAFHLDPRVLVVPRKWLSSRQFFYLRAGAATWAVGIWLYCLFTGNPLNFLVYYTMWNFSALTIYLCICTYLSYLHVYRTETGTTDTTSRHMVDSGAAEARYRPLLPALGIAAIVLFQLNFATVWIVDSVNWLVNYPYAVTVGATDQLLNFSSFNVHGVNLLVMLGDFVLTRIPYSHHHVCFLLIWVLAYAMFEWVDYAVIRHEYSYAFLDPTIPVAFAWYLGLAVFHMGIFWLCSLVSKWKLKSTSTEEYQSLA
jgi:hypothetical protein